MAALTTRVASALVLALTAAGVRADALEVTPAWGGSSRPGRMTELRVRAPPDARDARQLTIGAGAVRIEAALAPTGAAARYLHVDVPPAEAYRVALGGVGAAGAERRVELRLAELPLVALAVTGVGAWPDALARTEVGAEAFPAHEAGYDAVDAVALDATVLGALSGAQREALVAFIARCGIVTVVGAPAAAAALLGDAAGCGGGALRFVDDARDVPAAVTAALEHPATLPPAAAELEPLLAPAYPRWATLALLLAVYASGALAVGRRARSARAPLAYAALGAVAVAATLSLLPAVRDTVVWAEGEASGSRPGFVALARVALAHRGAATIALPPALGTPRRCGERWADEPARWQWRADDERVESIEVPGTLLGVATSCWRGTLATRRVAALDGPARGPWRVQNLGADGWPAGLLLAGGERYSLPALAGHAGHEVPGARGAGAASPAALLAAARAGGGAALLWPLDTRAFGLADAEGYLALRVARTGVAP